MENSKVNVKFEKDGKEYKLLNKCINDYLASSNKSIESETIDSIEKLLNNIRNNDYKIIDAYLEINDYKINSIDEIIELLSNIEDYQFIEIHNNLELGKFVLENVPDFDIPEYLCQFIDIEKLGEQYLSANNIQYEFCSNGALLYIRYMIANDLIDDKVKDEHKMRLLITNKQRYEKDNHYKRVELLFPISEKRLQEKIDILDLKNEQIKVLECSVLNLYPRAETYLTLAMERIISRLEFEEREILLSDVQALCEKMQRLDNIQIEKFIALLECKEINIDSFKDIIKLTDEIKNYNLLPDVNNSKDMGMFLVNETAHFDDVSILADYIDYEKLAKDYIKNGCTYSGTFTNMGYLMKKECLEIEQNEEEELE
ncbi:MAG: hypothetical protein ACI4VN_05570 [Clostridia bacterium]